MDQDGDGTAGEATQDQYVGAFDVVATDADAPSIVSHTPGAGATAPVTDLTFTFDEPMRAASFSLADIVSFNGPAGKLTDRITGFSGWTKRRCASTSRRRRPTATTA